ncbi:glucose-fructose oxidoreductase domain-containing protein 1 isoform X2 [Herpailurus yagouaroundi]|uniref:glucose-fructose oxidoreductase domain-containing protein 1 isoform X2 n=1 Tax=Herpailurus yagouaroundi TaxID=1608482 RepID=UPI001AD74AF4|nr:glucose-fructose oxidoreductase domain-containing protein 1 isoform X2 [Puma yagouaroundi]
MGEYIFGNKPVYTEKSGGPAGLGFSRENQVFFLQARLKGMGSVPRKPAGDIPLGFLCAHWMALPPLERPNGGPSKERACLLSWQPWPSPQDSVPVGLLRHRQERHLRPHGHAAGRLPHDVGRPLLPQAHEHHGQRAALPAGLRAHEAAHRGGLRGRAAGVRGAGARRQPAGQEIQLELRRPDGRGRPALGGHLHHRPAHLPDRPEGRQGPRAAQDLRQADGPHQGHPPDHQRRLLHLPDGAGGRRVLHRHPQLQRAGRVQAGRDRGGLGRAPPGGGHGPVRAAQQRPRAGAAATGRHARQQLPAAREGLQRHSRALPARHHQDDAGRAPGLPGPGRPAHVGRAAAHHGRHLRRLPVRPVRGGHHQEVQPDGRVAEHCHHDGGARAEPRLPDQRGHAPEQDVPVLLARTGGPRGTQVFSVEPGEGEGVLGQRWPRGVRGREGGGAG